MTRIRCEIFTQSNFREVTQGRDHQDLVKLQRKGVVDKQSFREVMLQICERSEVISPDKVCIGVKNENYRTKHETREYPNLNIS